MSCRVRKRRRAAPAGLVLLVSLTFASWAAWTPGAFAAATPGDAVCAQAAALAAVWDHAVAQLRKRAEAMNVPAPVLLDLTIEKGMDSSDLRMQLLTWSNAYVSGRAWVDGVDAVPRPVGVLDQKQTGGGIVLTVVVGVQEVSPSPPSKTFDCLFDISLSTSDGKVSGRYTTKGVTGTSLPIQSAKGSLRGVVLPAAGVIPKPNLRAPRFSGTEGDLLEARKYLCGAALVMRQFRAMDILLTQSAGMKAAWDAASMTVPEFPAGDTAAKPVIVTTSGTRALGVEDLIEKEMDQGNPDRTPAAAQARSQTSTATQATPATPATLVRIAAIAELVGRMKRSAADWASALPSSGGLPRIPDEAAADPDFGPWYGTGCLATNAAQPNLLPDTAAAEGRQQWLAVRNWRFVGPFPMNEPEVASPNLVEFLDDTKMPYATDVEGLKANKETFVPSSGLVFWQATGQQFEEGLQRPPVWRGVTEENDDDPTKQAGVVINSGPWNGYSYARTEIHSSKDADLWVALGADEHGRLWVNDRLVLSTIGRDDEPERIVWGKARFRKGVNVLTLRCDNMCAVRLGGRSGLRRFYAQHSVLNYFWVKVAVSGKPLDAAMVRARQDAVAGRRAEIRNLPANVVSYRNNSTANWQGVNPVTAWDMRRGKNVLWRVPLPDGKASATVLGDRVVALGNPHFVYCFDKMTGKLLWEKECNILEFTAPDKLEESRRIWAEWTQAKDKLLSLGRWWDEWELTLAKQGMTKEEANKEIRARMHDMSEKGFEGKSGGAYGKLLQEHAPGIGWSTSWTGWVGPSYATPATDGERIYVRFTTGVAACFTADGTRVWMVRIPAPYNDHTACRSPLLIDGKFIVEMGVKGVPERSGAVYTHFLALDARDGRELWRSEPLFQKNATSSSAPMVVTDGREDMPVVVTAEGAVIRVADGKLLCRANVQFDTGNGSPTVDGSTLYCSSASYIFSALRLVMLDRDTVGLRRLFSRPMPCGFDAGLAYDGGILYGAGGGQRPLGYTVFDTKQRKVLRFENNRSIRQGIPPYANGRQYVPTTVAGDCVFVADHGSNFERWRRTGVPFTVLQKAPDGHILASSEVDLTCTTAPVFDGDRIYIRTNPALICVGYTGEDGRAYEANENARYLLNELEVAAPEDTPPVDIAPTNAPLARVPSGFSRYLSGPVMHFGPFPLAKSDAVLAKLGGPENASVGLCREPEKGPAAPGVREPVELDGEQIPAKWSEDTLFGVFWYGNCLNNQVGKGAFFQAAIRNDEERVVRVWASHEPPDIWICGLPVREGTRVRLKPGVYPLLARVHSTEDMPAAPGFHFRLDDSSDVAAERREWQERLRLAKPVLDRIVKHGTSSRYVEKARNLLNAIGK